MLCPTHFGNVNAKVCRYRIIFIARRKNNNCLRFPMPPYFDAQSPCQMNVFFLSLSPSHQRYKDIVTTYTRDKAIKKIQTHQKICCLACVWPSVSSSYLTESMEPANKVWYEHKIVIGIFSFFALPKNVRFT